MSLHLSKRSNIDSFRVMKNVAIVNERVAAGEDIIQLHYGQPCFGAPKEALEKARQILLSDPQQGYTTPSGMSALKERIALHYAEKHEIQDLNPDRVIITNGSSGAFVFAFMAAFNPGDTVAVTTPTYPAYRNILKTLDINIVEIPTTLETNYQPTLDLLQNCGEKFDGLIINSPANPTGCIIESKELQKICSWCDETSIRLISDEAYHNVTFTEGTASALHYSKTGIITNTFSKYFCMTGWRLGWLICPDEDMSDRIKKLAENLVLAPPTLSQHLALKIFNHQDALDSYVAQYKRNQDILRTELPKAGFENLSPMQGAFYTYIDISKFTNNSEEFCLKMLNEAKVSVTAGLDFDLKRGHQTMRISYAGSEEDMIEACQRLQNWLG